jgi:long-subunit acyl-CoA synthetase (AMP-forming)
VNTLADLFRERADRFGAAPCIVTYGDGAVRELTYEQFYRCLARKSALFVQYGLHEGDVVALLADNSVEYLTLLYSATIAGLQVLLVSTKSPPEHIAYFLETADVKCVFRSSGYEPLCTAALALAGRNQPAACSMHDLSEFVPKEPDLAAEGASRAGELPGAGRSPDDGAIIFHTSGTTKIPKMVRLTHRNILSNQEAVHGSVSAHWTAGDRTLSWLPLYHGYGVLSEFLRDIYAGATFVIGAGIRSTSVDDVLRAVEDLGITILVCVPWMVELLVAKIEEERRLGTARALNAIHKLRYIVVGGSALDHRLVRFCQANAIRLVQSFGMTEAAGALFYSDFDRNDPESLRPIAAAGLRLVERDSRTKEHELVFVDCAMISAGAFGQSRVLGGSLATGDCFTPLGNGWTYVGRTDLIYNGPHGEKINPVHFESQLEKLDCVERVFVHGQDLLFNAALVQLVEGRVADSATKAVVSAFVRDRVNPELDKPARVYPNDIVILQGGIRIPLTPKGSVNRREALDLLKGLRADKERTQSAEKAS